MPRQLVGSREYKVMLLPERFAGDEKEARSAVDAFWKDVSDVLAGLDIPTEGSFDEVKAHRRIRFFDTAERALDGNKYVVRERIDVGSDERQLTLKYRHADRYLAQDRDMDPKKKGDDDKTKFEEDVKPPFISVFSYSTTVLIDADQSFASIDEVVDLFPGHGDKLPDDAKGDLAVVSDFCARELVLVGANVLLGKRDIAAECAMVIWHDDDNDETPPVCVEFSFKYEDDDEDYKGTVTEDAHAVLGALHKKMPEWVHPEPVTKTAFVYRT